MLDQPGVWLRAGMGGTIVGLDIARALAWLPPEIDRDQARELLAVAEVHYVAAALKRAEKDS